LAASICRKVQSRFAEGFYQFVFIVLPIILILGFCGIIAVSLGQAKDPSIVIFSLLLKNGAVWLSISILILALTLVISSMDTLINAISSLIIIESKKIIKSKSTDFYLSTSKIFLILISCLVFLIASQGMSVLYMFLLADLLCCAAAIPVFYGMFKNDISGPNSMVCVCAGLITGLLLFPDLSFQK